MDGKEKTTENQGEKIRAQGFSSSLLIIFYVSSVSEVEIERRRDVHCEIFGYFYCLSLLVFST